ncbi:MAG: sulfite exporter TauE/SafE family protein [Thermoleophilia bacterium]
MVSFSNTDGSEAVTEITAMFLGLTREKLLALLIVGLVGGLLSGFIGSGGAFVLTPAMMSLGAPGAVAVASNMCHKFPKAMVGSYKRFRYGQVDVKLGLVIAASSIAGVQVGFQIQKWILDSWGSAGSDLYVSFVFVIILVVVGGIIFKDAVTTAKGETEVKTPKLAARMQKIKIPPMIHFKKADVVISAWVTLPVGFATGLLAATIAVGGFVGVPGMVYMIGATAMVASATELLVAFVMGMWGSIQWALAGLIDIRLVLIILATSLLGVQLGALGTTYVRDHTIKLVMGTVMLIVAVSRGVKVPVYLAHLNIISLDKNLANRLDSISFWALIAALLVAGGIITAAMIKGITRSRIEEKEAAVAGRA